MRGDTVAVNVKCYDCSSRSLGLNVKWILYTTLGAELLEYIYLTLAFCACSQDLCAATRAIVRFDGIHDGCDSRRYVGFAFGAKCSRKGQISHLAILRLTKSSCIRYISITIPMGSRISSLSSALVESSG
jgi:hypothetical protein